MGQSSMLTVIVAAGFLCVLAWCLKTRQEYRRLLSGYDQVSAYAHVLELEIKELKK